MGTLGVCYVACHHQLYRNHLCSVSGAFYEQNRGVKSTHGKTEMASYPRSRILEFDLLFDGGANHES